MQSWIRTPYVIIIIITFINSNNVKNNYFSRSIYSKKYGKQIDHKFTSLKEHEQN